VNISKLILDNLFYIANKFYRSATMINDDFKEQGLRQQLVKEIIKKGIKDPNIIQAIGKIPRH